eukprot:COSAG02_NODE_61069_length_269_cov_1.182353_1_plen_57_part_01
MQLQNCRKQHRFGERLVNRSFLLVDSGNHTHRGAFPPRFFSVSSQAQLPDLIEYISG